VAGPSGGARSSPRVMRRMSSFGSPPLSPGGGSTGFDGSPRFDLGSKSGIEAMDDHVPYRSSKLTRILRQSLGGNSFTAVLLCITPAAQHQ